MSKDRDRQLRRGQLSGRSSMPSFIRFCNRTNRLVDIIWLNYEGLGVRYRTLPPRNFIDVNTFVGHPWIFRDSLTGDKCVAQFKTVYEPIGNGDGPPKRRVVNITIPVFKLRDRCLQVLRAIVPRHAIQSLEIPVVLKDELIAMASDHDISMVAQDEGVDAPPDPPMVAQPPNRSPNDSRILNPRIPSKLANLLVQPTHHNAASEETQPQPGSSSERGTTADQTDQRRTALFTRAYSSDNSDSDT
ncbi:hypothetical protein CAPTEDRAFT_167535 [Capitella teleta]|uniref:von Hippel-Lindau disease tumour suppressor beta domain-containing protein n=1 Tax=Capitella teleta TaxID=283909 RepID=X1ZB33_CAPTE|nr:hypothetical protein CAPTEDRAFT_167535 [Capitella teleta]|eukprot:ELU10094.1 hypothetical protein CAPTEDRAFT_167535 [Capitella teleta]